MDAEVAAAFREAGGVLARRDHPQLASRLVRLARVGRVWSPLPGIFGLPDIQDRPEARVAAAALWCGPDAVVCGLAAARLSYWPTCRVTDIEVALPGRARRPRPGWLFVQRRIPAELVLERGGIRITAPALTAIDLAAGPFAGDAIDRALRTGAATLPQLQAALEATPGRRGNLLRAELLHDSRDEPWSEAERVLHRLLRKAGITGWRANVWIGDEAGGFVVDVLFDKQRLIVEADGWEVHGTRSAFESDRYRRNTLVLAGHEMLNFTWRQLVDEPDWVVGCVLRALAERQ